MRTILAMSLVLAGCAALGAAARPNGAQAQAHEQPSDFSSQLGAFWNALRGDSYALDARPRYLDAGEALSCPREDLVSYRGTHVRYERPVLVNRAFVPRLERFEQVLVELSVARYGRAPKVLRHAGAYACRPVRGREARISEHALGNALDFRGVDLAMLPRRTTAPAEMPSVARRARRIEVGRDWNTGDGARPEDVYDSEFLHDLATALAARTDIFRGMVGPPHPRHHDHLHLDAGPWAYHWFQVATPSSATSASTPCTTRGNARRAC